jgi:branched-chain amino acid aminotransferase
MTAQWLDGRLVDEADAVVGARLEALRSSVPTCITTARVTAGKALHAHHHVRRLVRDSAALGFGAFDERLVIDAFKQLGEAVFGIGTGVVRIEALPAHLGNGVQLHATTRPLGNESNCWTARTAPMVHPGPQAFPGAKLGHCTVYEDARAYKRITGMNEVLLFNSAGRLVEGSVSNVLVVRQDGSITTPDIALGAVAGIALKIIQDHTSELFVSAIDRRDVENANEIIMVNAVRGARPLVHLDDKPIGSGAAGPWARRLDAMLLPSAGS